MLTLEPDERALDFGRSFVPLAFTFLHRVTNQANEGETHVADWYRLRFVTGFAVQMSVVREEGFLVRTNCIGRYHGLSSCCGQLVPQHFRHGFLCNGCGARAGSSPPYNILRREVFSDHKEEELKAWVHEWYSLQIGPLQAELDGPSTNRTLHFISRNLFHVFRDGLV